jgi:uncharacterized protein (TIGR02145 family)
MKNILLLLALFTAFYKISAQDIIYKINGTEIQSLVTEITADAIKYRNFNQPDGPIRNIAINDVFMIIYKDGTKEVFKKKEPAHEPVSEVSGQVATKEAKTPVSQDVIYGENNFMDPRDGKVYKTVPLGNQIWMAENLKTTLLNDGTPIQLVPEASDWKNLTIPGYCYAFGHFEDYGALYNGFTIETGKLCPLNWHVPTDEEWEILINYLGGREIAGEKMKDQNGFNAVFTGFRFWGDFMDLGSTGIWWSETGNDFLFIWESRKKVYKKMAGVSKNEGLSVRCIKSIN